MATEPITPPALRRLDTLPPGTRFVDPDEPAKVGVLLYSSACRARVRWEGRGEVVHVKRRTVNRRTGEEKITPCTFVATQSKEQNLPPELKVQVVQ